MTRTPLRLLLCSVLGAVLLVAAPTAEANAPVTVRGVVTDQDGTPLVGVRLQVWDGDAAFVLGETVTDASGHYRISYQVTDYPEYLDAYAASHSSQSREISGLPGRTYTVDMTLKYFPPPPTPPTISGDVVNGAGIPVPSGTVTLLNTDPGGDCAQGPYDTGDGSECWDGGRIAIIDEGHFETKVTSHYQYSVVIKAAHYATRIVHGVRPGDHVEIALTRGDGTIAPVTVAGVVTDSAGDPVAGVDVALVDPDTDMEETYGSDPEITRATTDAVGSYTVTFDPLAIDNIERPLVVQVETPDGPVRWPAGDISVGHYYEPGMAITTDIALGPTATVTGEVRDADGNLMTGVEVCCGLDSARATTDDAGRYSLEVLPGAGRVYVPGRRGSTDFVAQPGAALTADLQVVPPPVVEPPPPPPEPDITRPAQPQNVTTGMLRHYRVKVSFRPAYSGGRPIQAFRARCVGWRNDVPALRGRAADSPVVLGRLRPDRRYICQVRARNALGWGRWSRDSRYFVTPPR